MDSIFKDKPDLLCTLRSLPDPIQQHKLLGFYWRTLRKITEAEHHHAVMCLMNEAEREDQSPPTPQPSPSENLTLQIQEKTEARGGRSTGEIFRIGADMHVGVPHIRVQIPRGTLWLLVKPCQGGKTRRMLECIVNALSDHNKISIIFCEKSLLATGQTRNRAIDHLTNTEEDITLHKNYQFGKDDRRVKLVEISSAKRANVHDVNKLQIMCINNNIDVIVACAHPKRFQDIVELIDFMQRHAKNRTFEIFIDEADKYACQPKNVARIKRWIQQGVHVTFITATPQESETHGLFKIYAPVGSGKTLNLISLNETYSLEHYAGMKEWDNVWDEEAYPKESASNYIRRILTKYPLKNGEPGVCRGEYIFAPAKYKRKSHEAVSNIMLDFDILVVILNGEHKEMRWRDKKGVIQTYDLRLVVNDEGSVVETIWVHVVPKAMELGKSIAITGNYCIERALTLQKPNLIFDRAILTPCLASNSVARAYQQGSRINGNTKQMQGYKRSKVFTSSRAYTNMKIMEDMAMRLGDAAVAGTMEEPTQMNNAKWCDHFVQVKARNKNGVEWFCSEPFVNNEDGKIPEEVWESGVSYFNDNVAGKIVYNKDGTHREHHEGSENCIGTRTKEGVQKKYYVVTEDEFGEELREWHSSGTGKTKNKLFLSDIKKHLSTGVSSKLGKHNGQMVRLDVVYYDQREDTLCLVLRYKCGNKPF